MPLTRPNLKFAAAGSVIQTVSANWNNTIDITGTTVTATGLKASITPLYSNSKIEIHIQAHINNRRTSGSGAIGQKLELQKKVGSGSYAYLHQFAQAGVDYQIYHNIPDSTGNKDIWHPWTVFYTDTPGTTSTLEFQLYGCERPVDAAATTRLRVRGGNMILKEIKV